MQLKVLMILEAFFSFSSSISISSCFQFCFVYQSCDSDQDQKGKNSILRWLPVFYRDSYEVMIRRLSLLQDSYPNYFFPGRSERMTEGIISPSWSVTLSQTWRKFSKRFKPRPGWIHRLTSLPCRHKNLSSLPLHRKILSSSLNPFLLFLYSHAFWCSSF